MAKELVSDELWNAIEPLLADETPKPKGGRPRVDDHSALAGIIFVLKSGIPWEMLPKEMGCGSGTTCWRRLDSGKKRGCGSVCTRSFWITSERPTEQIGSALVWTRLPYRQKGGHEDRQESDG